MTDRRRFPRLTSRQAQVLLGLAAGLSKDEVGLRLGISLNTVKRHIEVIAIKTRSDSVVPHLVWLRRQELEHWL